MRTLRISEIKDRNENNEISMRRIASNYPTMKNNVYRLFLGAKIENVSNVGEMIAKMGETLCEIGLITLWDNTTLNVSNFSIDQDGNDEALIGAYTDYRTNRASKSGAYFKMSITTSLNNKTSDDVDMHFRFKTDRYMLAYVSAKLFFHVLNNLCYNDTRIATLDLLMKDNIAKLMTAFGIKKEDWERITKMF